VAEAARQGQAHQATRGQRPGPARGSALTWTGGPESEGEAEQWRPEFAPAAVASTMRALVGQQGDVVTRDGDRNIWILPHGAGGPIYLVLPRAEPEACEVFAGFGFHATVLAQTEADDGSGESGGDLAGLVCAITQGLVTEFFDFGDVVGEQPDGREFGHVGHRSPTSWTDERLAIKQHPIPAWERPLE
jgi:hypothetical protein